MLDVRERNGLLFGDFGFLRSGFCGLILFSLAVNSGLSFGLAFCLDLGRKTGYTDKD